MNTVESKERIEFVAIARIAMASVREYYKVTGCSSHCDLLGRIEDYAFRKMKEYIDNFSPETAMFDKVEWVLVYNIFKTFGYFSKA